MFCHNCGTNIEDKDIFCGECGSNVNFTKIENNKEYVQKNKNPDNSDLNKLVLEDYITRRVTNSLIWKGIGFMLAGVVITLIAYSLASEGGTYFIFWGLSLYGFILLVKGLYFKIFPNKLLEKLNK